MFVTMLIRYKSVHLFYFFLKSFISVEPLSKERICVWIPINNTNPEHIYRQSRGKIWDLPGKAEARQDLDRV